MNEIKQALTVFKLHQKSCLAIGIATSLLIYAVSFVPYMSAFLFSSILLLADGCCVELTAHSQSRVSWRFFKKNPSAFFATSLMLLPTIILSGSSLGILQNPQEPIFTYPLALGLFWLGIIFYFLLSQALRLHVESDITFFKAVDKVALIILKNFKGYLSVSFYLSLGLMLAELTRGLVMIVLVPTLFISSHFLYAKSTN